MDTVKKVNSLEFVISIDAILPPSNSTTRDVSKCDTSKVNAINYMLNISYAFEKDLNEWKTSKVTCMHGMIYNNIWCYRSQPAC